MEIVDQTQLRGDPQLYWVGLWEIRKKNDAPGKVENAPNMARVNSKPS